MAGTSDPAVVGEHKFAPEYINVPARATVTFSNDEFNVGGFGPPHTWTVLAEDCDPALGPTAVGGCRFDSGVLEPGQAAEVDLSGLRPGRYTVICRVGQEGDELPFSLVFSPHATETADGWTGMVGTLTVGKP